MSNQEVNLNPIPPYDSEGYSGPVPKGQEMELYNTEAIRQVGNVVVDHYLSSLGAEDREAYISNVEDIMVDRAIASRPKKPQKTEQAQKDSWANVEVVDGQIEPETPDEADLKSGDDEDDLTEVIPADDEQIPPSPWELRDVPGDSEPPPPRVEDPTPWELRHEATTPPPPRERRRAASDESADESSNEHEDTGDMPENFPELEEIHNFQRELGNLKQLAHQHPEKARQITNQYNILVQSNAFEFVDLLSKPEVQAHFDQVELTETGFDLIAQALKMKEAAQDLPSAEVLQGVGRIVKNQEVQNTAGWGDRPKYTTKFDEEIGPYDPSDDKVDYTLERLDPDYWLLPDDTRSLLEELLRMDRLEKPPASYAPAPHRYPWAKALGLRQLSEGIKRKRHQRSQKPVDPDQLRTTREIVAWFQGKHPVEVDMALAAKNLDKIFAAAKKRAQPILERDSELRYSRFEPASFPPRSEFRSNPTPWAHSEEFEREVTRILSREEAERTRLTREAAEGNINMTPEDIDEQVKQQTERDLDRARWDHGEI